MRRSQGNRRTKHSRLADGMKSRMARISDIHLPLIKSNTTSSRA